MDFGRGGPKPEQDRTESGYSCQAEYCQGDLCKCCSKNHLKVHPWSLMCNSFCCFPFMGRLAPEMLQKRLQM